MKENCCGCEFTYSEEKCDDGCEMTSAVMKYKVGDTPVVKNILPDHTGAHYTVGEMRRLEGQKVTIIKVKPERNAYYIKEDSGIWAWDDGMFEDPSGDQE